MQRSLMQLAPWECREKKIPCRHIPLNGHGETLDSFYRTGTQQELEDALIEWLRHKIRLLERARP
jgi:hypothetical protein